MSLESLLNEQEFRRCKGSGPTDIEACIHFLTTHWHIAHPERGRILFPMRQAQKDVLCNWLTDRYTITLKSRQIGFSTLAAAMSFWIVFFHSDKSIVFLSKTQELAIDLLRKSKYGYKHLPEWLKQRGPKPQGDTLQRMAFDNDSVIESLPSREDPARGRTVYAIFVDEWASLENPDEAWASIEPVTDIGGRCHGLSTAKGSGDFFHKMWLGATAGRNQFVPIFQPWSAVTERGEGWYEMQQEKFSDTPWVLHQEYPRNPEEAFVKSGMTVFDPDMLDALELKEPWSGYFHILDGTFGYEPREQTNGPLTIWEFPNPESTYVIGADVAEGLGHGDYSSAHVLDCRSGLVVAAWHGHLPADEFGEELFRLGMFYNYALLGVEVNNHGLTTCVALQKMGYRNLYYQTNVGGVTMRTSRKVGLTMTKHNKPMLIDELARSIRSGDTIIYDRHTIGEMRTYVRNPENGQMHGSPFDDRVMSFAITHHMRQFAYMSDSGPSGGPPVWSMDWWVAETEQANKPKTLIIGGGSRR